MNETSMFSFLKINNCKSGLGVLFKWRIAKNYNMQSLILTTLNQIQLPEYKILQSKIRLLQLVAMIYSAAPDFFLITENIVGKKPHTSSLKIAGFLGSSAPYHVQGTLSTFESTIRQIDTNIDSASRVSSPEVRGGG